MARDRYFQFHNCKNGQRLGGYSCAAWCTALSYDEGAKYAFIGDYSGQVTVLQLSENGVKLINVLKGHSGSIQSLCWDQSQGWLYSGMLSILITPPRNKLLCPKNWGAYVSMELSSNE